MRRIQRALAIGVAFASLGGPVATASGDGGCAGAWLAPKQATPHQLRTSVLCLVNEARARNDLRPLRYSKELRRSADGHSKYMVRSGNFSHYGSRGSTLTRRVAHAGYLTHASAYAVGENIGGGPGRRFGSPKAIVRAWMHSSGHRANILNPAYREFGAGVARGSPFGGGKRAATYTLNLGMRR